MIITNNEPQVCRYFNTPGGCRRTHCQFLHGAAASANHESHHRQTQNNTYRPETKFPSQNNRNWTAPNKSGMSKGFNMQGSKDDYKQHSPAMFHCEHHGLNVSHDTQDCRTLGNGNNPGRKYNPDRPGERSQVTPEGFAIRGTVRRCTKCGEQGHAAGKCFRFVSEKGTDPSAQFQQGVNHFDISMSENSTDLSAQFQHGVNHFNISTGPRNCNDLNYWEVPRHSIATTQGTPSPTVSTPGSIATTQGTPSPTVSTPGTFHDPAWTPYVDATIVEKATTLLGVDIRFCTYCAICLKPLDPTISPINQEHGSEHCRGFYMQERNMADEWQEACRFFAEKWPFCVACGVTGTIWDANLDHLMHGMGRHVDNSNWMTHSGGLFVVVDCDCEGLDRSSKKWWISADDIANWHSAN